MCDIDIDLPTGARTHTIEVARAFAAMGLDVHLIARGPDPQLRGVHYLRAAGDEAEPGRRVVNITRLTISVLWRERHRARRLYLRHKWTTAPATIVGRLLGYRVVTEVDDVPYGRGYRGSISPQRDYFYRAITILVGRLSHGVVAGTEEARSLLTEQFHIPRRRVGVVPIGVDVDYFQPQDREAALRRSDLDPTCRYVLFMGNFAEWVDFDTLLGAFAAVLREAPSARLLLVGDGEQRSHVEATIHSLGIEPAVTLTGFVRDRAAVRDLLGAATVLVASHRGEHLDRIGMNATKIAEYLASGRAVVVKDVARLREMIQDTGAGRVVPEDPEAMASAILSLLEPERADAVGAIGRELAVNRYSWESTIRQTLPLFTLTACSRG
ncbi:MAG: glycosyltransferase family 4 protein [Solirubrobacteraceae bacterium]